MPTKRRQAILTLRAILPFELSSEPYLVKDASHSVMTVCELGRGPIHHVAFSLKERLGGGCWAGLQRKSVGELYGTLQFFAEFVGILSRRIAAGETLAGNPEATPILAKDIAYLRRQLLAFYGEEEMAKFDAAEEISFT